MPEKEPKKEKTWEHWQDLPEDMERKLIDRIAYFFVDRNLGLVAEMLLESGGSLTRVASTLGMGLFGPYLEFFGADTYMAFLRKSGNEKLLLERIEALEYEKAEKESKKKTEKKEEKKA